MLRLCHQPRGRTSFQLEGVLILTVPGPGVGFTFYNCSGNVGHGCGLVTLLSLAQVRLEWLQESGARAQVTSNEISSPWERAPSSRTSWLRGHWQNQGCAHNCAHRRDDDSGVCGAHVDNRVFQISDSSAVWRWMHCIFCCVMYNRLIRGGHGLPSNKKK